MKDFIKKLKFWLCVRNKACHRACPFCEYYDLCAKDFNSI